LPKKEERMTTIEKTVAVIKNAKHVTAFTGAGISVESGIPPFRGPDGLWNRVDPKIFDIQFFRHDPKAAWEILRSRFGEIVDKAKPNGAHNVLAHLETKGKVAAVITQNIDDLHQRAGSKTVYEFHGSFQYCVCLQCWDRVPTQAINWDVLPPSCKKCGGLMKPDFVFFGEPIPEPAQSLSFAEADKSDCFIVVGTSGKVMPACMIPERAKQNGATIIEINKAPSAYTESITDIFLPGLASEVLEKVLSYLQ
jgi:NAD-dependent protein deacetylase/lipoamidase